ncbi:MAG: hypothetical protein RBG1_1C00001G0459 [candidate division Zixibacteria bacterium RBG-1]|nr:MAG: hypothetical protein RBG1_1C00001G0459 [candidate division Zixibacteria bacterium RBG-1]OGC83448.1 MAG: hypothetical protein A2V73_01730 [candidate division Zixibacteria bacterium RBG_19FT_COMBO_42_43]
MFLCLSSGASQRYRQDILRALAMPEGALLQFRYDSKRVSPKILDSLEKNSKGKIVHKKCLIAYIDQQDKTKIPELIPCRFARLEEALRVGTTVSLRFSLEEFSYAHDLKAFNNEVSSASGNALPTWQQDGTIKGYYWSEINQEPTTVISSKEIDKWENIASQISARTDFANENYFYMINGIYSLKKQEAIISKDACYKLESAQEYEIRVYHFHPKITPKGPNLYLSLSTPLVTFTTSPKLIIDSRYDLKRARFRTAKPSTSQNAILMVLTDVEDSEKELKNLEFDILLKIKGTFWTSVAYAIGIGILITIPPITAAFSNPALPEENRIVISLISLFAGIITGILVVFGLKKPI